MFDGPRDRRRIRRGGNDGVMERWGWDGKCSELDVYITYFERNMGENEGCMRVVEGTRGGLRIEGWWMEDEDVQGC